MTEWQQRIMRNIVQGHNAEKILGENLELFSRTIEQKGNIISLIFMAEMRNEKKHWHASTCVSKNGVFIHPDKWSVFQKGKANTLLDNALFGVGLERETRIVDTPLSLHVWKEFTEKEYELFNEFSSRKSNQ